MTRNHPHSEGRKNIPSSFIVFLPLWHAIAPFFMYQGVLCCAFFIVLLCDCKPSFLMCRSIRAGFFFIRYAMPCFLVCFNRFLAPLHKPIIKPMLSRFCPNFFHPCSFLPIPRKPPTVAIPQTFVLVLPGIFHQVARTLGQAPATSARPVAGCHDIFCANSKRLSKHQNIVP